MTKVPLGNCLAGPAEETGAGAGFGHQEHLGCCFLLIQVFPPLWPGVIQSNIVGLSVICVWWWGDNWWLLFLFFWGGGAWGG